MEVWPRPPARDRSLYSRQEFQHSIVCFRKIRDGTAKASRAQFTLLNRRNGLEAPDECRLFPRYSAFKFSFRAVVLLFPSSPFLSLSPFLFNPYSTHACVYLLVARFDSRIFTRRIPPGFLIRWPRFLSPPLIASRESSGIRNYTRIIINRARRISSLVRGGRWTSSVQI